MLFSSKPCVVSHWHRLMMEYVYFDMEVFGGDGKISSLSNLLSFLDENDCQGIGDKFMSKIATDVASGLQYLHGAGVAHRDLKPANVLISNHHYREEQDRKKLEHAWNTEPLICKLTDFGESRTELVQTRSIFQTRTVNLERGTLPFMAPEILLVNSISGGATLEDLKRADMWAYGMLIFNIINPCLHYPYEIELRRSGKGDSKEKIAGLLSNRKKPEGSPKYRQKCAMEWSQLWKAYDACTNFVPSERLDAQRVLRMLLGGLDDVDESRPAANTPDEQR